jgi:hypothetical protein
MACMRPTGSCNFVSENSLKLFWSQAVGSELRLFQQKLQWSMLLWGHTPPDKPKEEKESASANKLSEGLNKFNRTVKAVLEDTLVNYYWRPEAKKRGPYALDSPVKKGISRTKALLCRPRGFETISGPFGPCKSRGAHLPCSLIKLNRSRPSLFPLQLFNNTHPLP